MGMLVKRYGDRFAEMPLNDFVRGNPKIAETVDLLVLRSTRSTANWKATQKRRWA